MPHFRKRLSQKASACILDFPDSKTAMSAFMNYLALKSFVTAFQVPRNLCDKHITCFFLKYNFFDFLILLKIYHQGQNRVFEHRSSNAFLTSCVLTPLVFQMPPQYVVHYSSWPKTHKTPQALLYI